MPGKKWPPIASCRHQLLPSDNADAELKKQILAGKKRSLSLSDDGLSGMTPRTTRCEQRTIALLGFVNPAGYKILKR